jgi:4-amino-4-deoxy-L-arabinose transferase-like glycosyltransferase
MRSAPGLQLFSKFASSPIVIFLAAFLIRLRVIAVLLPAHTESGFFPNEASRIAWAIVSGLGYSSPWPNTVIAPTAQQPPMYPYLLASIFKLAGTYTPTSLWIAVGLNAMFSAITAVLILRLGKREFGMLYGVLAAWIWAAWLYEAVVSIRLWESSLSALLLCASLLLLINLSRSLELWRWILFGSLAGIAALTNTTLLSLFPFFWVWLWVSYRRRGLPCSKRVLVSIATCLLTLAPWTIRNYVTFHHVIPVRDNFGLELWVGNHEGVTYLYDFTTAFPLHDPTEYNRLGELRFMENKRDVAFEFIRRHPGKFLQLTAERLFSFWTTPTLSLWLPVSILAWFGAGLALKHKGLEAMPFCMVMVIFPLIYYITHPWPTYRHPIEPVIIILMMYAVVHAVEAVIEVWRQRKTNRSARMLEV